MKENFITISTLKRMSIENNNDGEQRMTSLEIAELTGKQHKDVLKAIRNMEPAWERVNGRNFALVTYKDQKGELRPCYSLTKTECLYIATKFNDEARTRLVLRWKELEEDQQEALQSAVVAHYNLPDAQQAAIERHLNVNSFPTYKLFNRNGDLLDVNADPHDLEVLARLLEQMK